MTGDGVPAIADGSSEAGDGRRPGVGSNPARDVDVAEREVEGTFLRTVDQGRRRMSRRLGPLLATGLVGGIDVDTGVLGLLLVERTTGSTWLMMRGYPDLAETAIEAGGYYVELGLGLRALSLAILGGAVITLMTWMQQGTDLPVGRVIPAVTGAFLLGAGQLNPPSSTRC